MAVAKVLHICVACTKLLVRWHFCLLHVLRWSAGLQSVQVCLPAGGQAAMVTFAPLMEQDDIQFAALGLRNMLNGGGAILACSGLRSAAVSPASGP